MSYVCKIYVIYRELYAGACVCVCVRVCVCVQSQEYVPPVQMTPMGVGCIINYAVCLTKICP